MLKNIRKDKNNILDFNFLKTKKVLKYFEIYSKFYVGHMNSDIFVRLLKYLNITSISEDIPLKNIHNDQIIVTIEQNQNSKYSLVYYLKINNDKLKKLEVTGEQLIVSNKDPKGFTASETKYIKYIFKKSYKLTLDDIKNILSKPDFN